MTDRILCYVQEEIDYSTDTEAVVTPYEGTDEFGQAKSI
jgi:hypothetical protein